MADDYPHDADGDALRRIAADGNDMAQPMEIDFHVAAPDEVTAKRVADAASAFGYRTEIYYDDVEVEEDEEIGEPWTCECTKAMVPTYEAVVAAQAELDEIARPVGAYVDGWGTFGNAD